jgi:hypothetical protein
MRLGSDGDRFVVSVEPTSEGPEILVLFDLRPNHAPVAAAGPDQTIECTGPEGAEVLLDAGGSSDPDGDAIEFSWTGGPFGTAEGPAPIVTLPLGTWILTLLVQDPDAATSTDTVVVTVRDSVPPTIEVQAAPNRLWPPDGRLAPVLFGITTQDLCDPQPLVTLLSITSDDPKFDPAVDVGGASFGTDDRLVSLRSKRSGGNGGRTYSVAFEAADHSGNGATATGEVLVQKN